MIKFTISLSKVNINDKFINCSLKEQTSVDFIYDDYYPIEEEYLVSMLRENFDECLLHFYKGNVKEIGGIK